MEKKKNLPTLTHVSACSLVPLWSGTCRTKSGPNCHAIFNYRGISCDAEGVGEACPTRFAARTGVGRAIAGNIIGHPVTTGKVALCHGKLKGMRNETENEWIKSQ